MSAIDVLNRVPLFADLHDDELRAVAARLGKRIFAEDMILFHKGSPSQALYLIESGSVRAFALSNAGQEMTLDIYGPGECFGETALVDGQMRSAGAMTLERTVIYTLQREDFLYCLERHPAVARRALALLADRLNRLTAFTEHLAFLDVTARTAAVLLELAEHHGVDAGHSEIGLHLTQADLASYCVASRVMVNKVLGLLRNEGLIKIDGQAITILDAEGLRRRVSYKSVNQLTQKL
jgi:CRP/FNR family transcriptional regulator/CRP/FNR family cyclic AMP-dependent transcriptional regulator